MTKERAIEILNPEHRENYKDIETVNEACRMGMEALEYRTPKKPILIGDDYDSALSCPNCKQTIINVWNKKNYNPNYCHYCGQALDWT